MKIFLDANILVAACGSAQGGSRYLFYIAEQESAWHLLTSAYAVSEARANVERKLPGSLKHLSELLVSPQLTIVYPPSSPLITAARTVVPKKDAPILAAAIAAKADTLCTLDKKDFHTKSVKQWSKKYQLSITDPRALLTQWRNQKKE
jgi:uncharacterized protein